MSAARRPEPDPLRRPEATHAARPGLGPTSTTQVVLRLISRVIGGMGRYKYLFVVD